MKLSWSGENCREEVLDWVASAVCMCRVIGKRQYEVRGCSKVSLLSSGKSEFDGWTMGADSRRSTQIGQVRSWKEGAARRSSRIKRNPVGSPLCTAWWRVQD